MGEGIRDKREGSIGVLVLVMLLCFCSGGFAASAERDILAVGLNYENLSFSVNKITFEKGSENNGTSDLAYEMRLLDDEGSELNKVYFDLPRIKYHSKSLESADPDFVRNDFYVFIRYVDGGKYVGIYDVVSGEELLMERLANHVFISGDIVEEGVVEVFEGKPSEDEGSPEKPSEVEETMNDDGEEVEKSGGLLMMVMLAMMVVAGVVLVVRMRKRQS